MFSKALLTSITVAFTVDKNFDFQAHYDSNTKEIVFTTVQPDNSWFGILLGSATMYETDAISF